MPMFITGHARPFPRLGRDLNLLSRGGILVVVSEACPRYHHALWYSGVIIPLGFVYFAIRFMCAHGGHRAAVWNLIRRQ